MSQVITVERGLLVIGGRPLQRETEMKIRHPLFVGLVAAFTVSLATVAVSAVAAETPFKGTVNAEETVVPSLRPPHSLGTARAPLRTSAGTRKTSR